ncbi:MAG: SUMF1/EgtB/PvdO family nonheme iron enzyme [Polyangiaceae bacterium]
MDQNWWITHRKELLVVAGFAFIGLPLAVEVGTSLGGGDVTPARPSPTGGGPRMIRIPAATFLPGSDDDVTSTKPRVKVELPEFEIDETEVTVEQYACCVDAKACKAPIVNEGGDDHLADETAASDECNFRHRATRGKHPVNCVGIEMAAAFCRWAGKRLPTADEWEFAARGTDGRRYPWGNEEPSAELLNAQGAECINSPLIKDIRHQARSSFPWNDGYPLTAPVASFPKGRSAFGLYDMAGNVLEFGSDGEGLASTVALGGAWSFRWETLGLMRSSSNAVHMASTVASCEDCDPQRRRRSHQGAVCESVLSSGSARGVDGETPYDRTPPHECWSPGLKRRDHVRSGGIS